ncbi:hypothetical protein [Azospirillum sp. SYSU D00513]|uniref:hypothetical protein n=1 Tax=Azospirillum sp. SYSU D00513 TaxID=2812561 RepID=UPI001A959070|nr:hypothetical protein [Azospirillum sp. SYSU D00513]
MSSAHNDVIKFDIRPIHTLNSRGNIQLEVASEVVSGNTISMLSYIQWLRSEVEEALTRKGINYSDLRSTLEPQTHRREIALVFDTEHNNGWYGWEIFNEVIPLFDKGSKHSVLAGDYLPLDGLSKAVLLDAMEEAVNLVRSTTAHYVNQYFIVYINNLTDAMVSKFDNNLRNYRPYIGMADMTYGSKFKHLLSFMLPDAFIKHGKIIIQGCENDSYDDVDYNTKGWAFEENGYVCRSIRDELYGTLLSYKIERPILRGADIDTFMSLNSIELHPVPIDDFKIELAAAKAEYIRNHNASASALSGINLLSDDALKELIREKIRGSYIYHMSYLYEHDVRKFNVMIEIVPPHNGRPVRMRASLEYKPSDGCLRVITLY